jgi:hypothetical protein
MGGTVGGHKSTFWGVLPEGQAGFLSEITQ